MSKATLSKGISLALQAIFGVLNPINSLLWGEDDGNQGAYR